ncbi:uncharacterized protein GGS22DRAFT_157813 [Annulohypoxylon maeteangense]|uniref:uncharacterized protein n=1 Tax=Annulohypoxylon maeteangense TaxID=1927788 RepID=UPI002008920C|nr:uncharacterized protein GGS22DRAFT_157813 [Annulohypoxylon maeteangense]KAI0887664.1 hypothetical protein GGS22DRAFT_157813 [Annulohypoxylon maeteangense]
MSESLAVVQSPSETLTTSVTTPTVPTTTTPSISVLTLTVKPLTTTFTPPSSCGDMHLTQLSSPGYQLWLNEPQPVPGSKFGDCYPSGFIDGYTSVFNSSSSLAPLFSPLVCPEGWTVAKTWTNGYIACCAYGFFLHTPDTTVDPDRPAYGGTCYSNFQVGQTVKVTGYNSASVTATAEWVASATNDQAYAHPIDGFQAGSDGNSPSTRLSGVTIAGIVVGSVVGMIIILLALLFPLQRYRRKKTQQQPNDFHQFQQFQQFQQQANQQWQLSKELQSPNDSAGGTLYDVSPHSYANDQRYELGVQETHELDSGFVGRELEGGKKPRREANRAGR